MTRTYKLLSVTLILTIGIAMIGITSDAQAFGKKEGDRPSEAPGRPPFAGMDGDRAAMDVRSDRRAC